MFISPISSRVKQPPADEIIRREEKEKSFRPKIEGMFGRVLSHFSE